MRLAIVTNTLTPYRNPVFARLSARAGVDLMVLTFSEDQAHRQWPLNSLYEAKTFPCYRLSGRGGRFRMWRALRRFNPEAVVLGGYDVVEFQYALVYCKLHRKKAILWSGTTSRSVRRLGLVRFARNAFIRSMDSYVAYGRLAREFLIDSGATAERIVTGYNTVDVSFFEERADSFRNTPNYKELRSRIAPVSLLFVGRLIDGKGFCQLLAALERMERSSFTLVVLGDGPLRAEFESETRRRGIKTFFEGFRGAEELPAYYAACDVFVFPTLNDVWGLVINEAMACGMPVVSSTEAGASYDLVENGHNGWIVNPLDTARLAGILGELIADGELRKKMGEAGARAVRKFTPDSLADAILTAAGSVTGSLELTEPNCGSCEI